MKHFAYKLKDSTIRGMTREQYYKASHYVRYLAWKIDGMINWDKFHKHMTDSLAFGVSRISFEDLLK